MSLLNLILILRKTLTICWWLLLPGNSLATVFFTVCRRLALLCRNLKWVLDRPEPGLTKSTRNMSLKGNSWNMTVILTNIFQVSFKLWTTCVRQTHLSRPLPFHCASYSIWRCHVLIGVRSCDFEVFSPQFSWFGYDYSPLLMKISPQPLQILLFNSLSKLHYKRKGHFSFWTVFLEFASTFLLQTPLQVLQ